MCNAQLLRELTALSEPEHGWARQLQTLLLDIQQAVAQAKQHAQSALPDAQRQACETGYSQIVQNGLQVNPPSPPTRHRGRTKQSVAYNLLQRLATQREAILRFMVNFAVPFDNNLAERDLRMVKLRQKISGCFRSADAASIFCRLRGYISTLRKQRLSVLPALHSAIIGRPLIPYLK